MKYCQNIRNIIKIYPNITTLGNIVKLTLLLHLTIVMAIAKGACPQIEGDRLQTAQAEEQQFEQQLFKLLEKCQLISSHLEEHGTKADKARKLYGQHCFLVLDNIAFEQQLDVFYLSQAKYLSFNGKHAEAHPYIVQNYQINPHDFETNRMFIQNLIELDHIDTARELYNFFIQNEEYTLAPQQIEAIQSVKKQLFPQKQST